MSEESSDIAPPEGAALVADELTEEPPPRTTRGFGEWILAAALIAIGVVVLVDGLNQRQSTSASGIGAGLLPTIVGIVILVLAAVLVLQLVRGKRGEAEESEGDVDISKTHWGAVAITLVALLFFVFTVEPLGYIIATTVMFFLISIAMGARRYWMIALISVIVACVIYFSFTRLLTIELPAGILEGYI